MVVPQFLSKSSRPSGGIQSVVNTSANDNTTLLTFTFPRIYEGHLRGRVIIRGVCSRLSLGGAILFREGRYCGIYLLAKSQVYEKKGKGKESGSRY